MACLGTVGIHLDTTLSLSLPRTVLPQYALDSVSMNNPTPKLRFQPLRRLVSNERTYLCTP